MALSEYEKQVLAQMEEELRRADPELVSELTKPVDTDSSKDAPLQQAQSELSPRRIALGVIMAVIGLLLLITAVSLGYGVGTIALGVFGFGSMVGGILFAMSSRPLKKPRTAAESSDSTDGRGSGWARFIADQERRWDERSES